MVVQLSIEPLDWHFLNTTFLDDAQYSFSCLHYAYLSVSSIYQTCLPSPCGGRYSTSDYYGDSVTIGLASLRPYRSTLAEPVSSSP